MIRLMYLFTMLMVLIGCEGQQILVDGVMTPSSTESEVVSHQAKDCEVGGEVCDVGISYTQNAGQLQIHFDIPGQLEGNSREITIVYNLNELSTDATNVSIVDDYIEAQYHLDESNTIVLNYQLHAEKALIQVYEYLSESYQPAWMPPAVRGDGFWIQ